MVGSSTGTKNNESEMDTYAKRLSHEIRIEVYKHYRELAINEDRLLNERLMVFLTSNSILFLGYIMSFQSESFPSLIRIILPCAGIFLCVLCFFILFPAWKAWDIWIHQLEEIEGKFDRPELTPPSDQRKEMEKRCLYSGKWPWVIGCLLLPLTFIVLWVCSLFCSS